MPKRSDKQERESKKRARAKGTARSGQTPTGKSPSADRPTTDGELRRFKPVSDELVLAAIDRAERHRPNERQDVPLWDVAAHLGFVKSGWTTRQLRPQLDALIASGLLAGGRRYGFDVWGLSIVGRSHLRAASTARAARPRARARSAARR